jgi:hypothetical protein
MAIRRGATWEVEGKAEPSGLWLETFQSTLAAAESPE